MGLEDEARAERDRRAAEQASRQAEYQRALEESRPLVQEFIATCTDRGIRPHPVWLYEWKRGYPSEMRRVGVLGEGWPIRDVSEGRTSQIVVLLTTGEVVRCGFWVGDDRETRRWWRRRPEAPVTVYAAQSSPAEEIMYRQELVAFLAGASPSE